MIRLLVVLALLTTSLAATDAGWLYFLAEQGANWDGWVYRAPITNPTTSSTQQLSFTQGARSMIADNNYVYWGLFNGTWYIARASHDLTTIDYSWLMMDGSVCGKGLIIAWAVDTVGNTLWYQGQADYALCALNMTTMTARNYGKFLYNGGGGMNGQLQIYRDPATNEVAGLLWGLDQGEQGSSGCIVYMDVQKGPSKPRNVICNLLQFPRPGIMLPATNTTIIGGYNTAGQLYAVDIFTSEVLLQYNASNGAGSPCNAALDPITNTVYLGAPGATSFAGVFALPAGASTYTKIIGAGSIGCPYCICDVSVARPNAPPPPTPPPPPPPPASVPYVQWVIPVNGSDAGGYMLYVAGSGFVNSSTLTCRVGRTLVPASRYIDSDLIGCVVPESPIPGQALIAVANDGTTFSTEQVYFTYLDEMNRRR